MNVDTVGPASLALSQTVMAFQSFLPSFADVRKADPITNPDVVGDVRMGEIAAMSLAMGVGVIMSGLTQSPIPIVVTAVVAIVLLCLYETALNGDRPGNPRAIRTERARAQDA